MNSSLTPCACGSGQILCGQRAPSQALLHVHHDRNDLRLHRRGFNGKYSSHKHHKRQRQWPRRRDVSLFLILIGSQGYQRSHVGHVKIRVDLTTYCGREGRSRSVKHTFHTCTVVQAFSGFHETCVRSNRWIFDTYCCWFWDLRGPCVRLCDNHPTLHEI